MNNELLISVIVPVYNTEKYVRRCIESILKQSYQNIEVILVDDGSTDESLSICNEFIHDSRIKIITQNNQGVSVARNHALENANGQYVVFVDSDDEILSDMFVKMITLAKEHGADLILCGVLTNNGIYCKKNLHYQTIKVFQDDELFKEYLTNRKNIMPTAWAKMYRKELFNYIRFPVNRIYEDAYIMPQLFSAVSKAVYIPECLYVQNVCSESITRSRFSAKKLDIITCEEHLIEFVEENYPEYLQYVAWRKTEAMVGVMRKIIMDHSLMENRKIYNEIREKLTVEYERALNKEGKNVGNNKDVLLAINRHFLFITKYVVVREMQKVKSRTKKIMMWTLRNRHEKGSI